MLIKATVHDHEISIIKIKRWREAEPLDPLILSSEEDAWNRAMAYGEAFALLDDMKMLHVTRLGPNQYIGSICELPQPRIRDGWLYIFEINKQRHEFFLEHYFEPQDILMRLAEDIVHAETQKGPEA